MVKPTAALNVDQSRTRGVDPDTRPSKPQIKNLWRFRSPH